MLFLFDEVWRPLESQLLSLFGWVQLVALEGQPRLVKLQYLLALVHFLLLAVEVTIFHPLLAQLFEGNFFSSYLNLHPSKLVNNQPAY